MKYLIYALLIGLAAAGTASAATWTIDDNYIGGGYQSRYAQNGGDVISGSSPSDINEFDIDSMIVEIDNQGHVTITIVTDYASDIAGFGTTYGDLFISIDGLDSIGESPYYADTYSSTLTDWEYVFDSDTGYLYSLEDASDSAYLLSQDFFGPEGSVSSSPASWYRTDQLVQVDTNELADSALLGLGTFDSDTFNTLLIYTFDLTDLGLDLTESYELAFRWTMTCANDVIEGSVSWQPVPEPKTMVLLGLGLLGLGAVGRKKLAPAQARRSGKIQ